MYDTPLEPWATEQTAVGSSEPLSSHSHTHCAANEIKYIYPTSLGPANKKHSAVGMELYGHGYSQHQASASSQQSSNSSQGAASAAGGTGAETTSSGSSSSSSSKEHSGSALTQYPQHRLPATLPLSRGRLPIALSAREHEIYACSDSEDERLEIPRPPTYAQLASGAHFRFALEYISPSTSP